MNIELRPEQSAVEMHVSSANKLPKEVLRARRQAETLIDNNELHWKLGLVTTEDKKIFDLSVEERLIRNEIVDVSNKIVNISSRGVLGFINREIIKHYENKKDKLYKAKEILSSEKEDVTKDFHETTKVHAHNIELAANDLFRKAQEIHRNALIPETILDDWIVDRWALTWKNKFIDE